MNAYDLINADFAALTSKVEVAPGVGFVIVGSDSPQYLAENDRQRNEGYAYRRAVNRGDSPKVDLDTAEGAAIYEKRLDTNLHATAVAVTVGWYGFTDAKSKKLTFDPAIAAQMFAKKKAWRGAVISAIDEDARFLPVLAKS